MHKWGRAGLRRCLVAGGLVLVATLRAAASTAAAPTVEQLTAAAEFDNLRISPQGTRLALSQWIQGKHAIRVVAYPSLEPVMAMHFGNDVDVDDLTWVDEDRLLVQPARLFHGYRVHKVPTGEIIRVDVKAAKSELIFGYQAGKQQTGTRVAQRTSVEAAGELITARTGTPGTVLIRTIGYSAEGEQNTAYRMNIESGLLNRVAGSPVRDGVFVTGTGGNVSIVYGDNDRNETLVFHRAGGAGLWEQRLDGRGEGVLRPIAWAGDGESYYALDDRDAPTSGVVVWNAATNTQRLLFRDPKVDTYPVGVDRDGRPWGFEVFDHYPRYWYPDPAHPIAAMHAGLVKRLPNHLIRVTSFTDDQSLATVRVSSAMRPPTYFVVRVATGELLLVMPAYPALKVEDMAPVEAVEFRAQDGLPIRAYLTTPRSADGKPGKKLPLVVLVHGGPHGIADDYGWDFERQLLAAKGYAVLQVNYRGSGGRGREYEFGGYGKWGREMQDDVTAGVRWAVQDGVADGARICIFGASYGAYSALTGAFRDPDLYRCAIGMAGVYDLPLMFEKGDIQSHARGVNYLKAALGDDTAELRARSPVYNAKAIRAKVMLLHGKSDVRAPYAHAERMRKALIEAGNPPEWIVEHGEAHGFFNTKNRADAYDAIVAFLDRHIGH